MVAADPEEQNKEVEVCMLQRHQMLEEWRRIHLESENRELQFSFHFHKMWI